MISKKEIRKKYPGVSRDILMHTANLIISAHRRIPYGKARWKKHLTDMEFEFFRKHVGNPVLPGQKIDEYAPTKKYIKHKYGQTWPKKWLIAEINDVIRAVRPYIDPRKVKILIPKEYEMLKKRLE